MTQLFRLGTTLGTFLALSLASTLAHAEDAPAQEAAPSAVANEAPVAPASPPRTLFLGIGGGPTMGEAMGLATTGGSVQGWAGLSKPISSTIELRLGGMAMHDWSKTDMKTGVWRTRAGGRLGFMIGGKLELGGTAHVALIELQHRKHDGSLMSPGLGASAFALLRPYKPVKGSFPFTPFLMATATGDAFLKNGNSSSRLFDTTAMLSFGLEFDR
jgi:hypothetical protein